jgi:hypothetical protein
LLLPHAAAAVATPQMPANLAKARKKNPRITMKQMQVSD